MSNVATLKTFITDFEMSLSNEHACKLCSFITELRLVSPEELPNDVSV